jgi:DNA-binding MarR family transcriptional regulator
VGRYSYRMRPLDQRQYERLLRFRTGLRRFLRWSAEQAAAAGLTPAQHQLLLAIRGHPDAAGPTVGDVARSLLLRHHSTVELVDRAQAAGLVERHPDANDSRVVRLGLTPLGTERLEALTALHLEELTRLGSQLQDLWRGLGTTVDNATRTR